MCLAGGSSRGLRQRGCGESWVCPRAASPPMPFLLTPAAVRPLPAPKFCETKAPLLPSPAPRPHHLPSATIRTLCGLAVVMAAAPGEAFRLGGLSSQLQPEPVCGGLRLEPGAGKDAVIPSGPVLRPVPRSPQNLLAGKGKVIIG